MAKYIVTFLVLIGLGTFVFINLESESPEEAETSQVDVTKVSEIEESPEVEKEITKKGTIVKKGNVLNLYKKRFGLDLSTIGISKELQSGILFVTFPGFFQESDVQKIEEQIDKKIKESPEEMLSEISGLISNYRDKIPTKVKGLLFMKMADLKGFEKKVREMSLNELDRFTSSSVILTDKTESPEHTLVESVSLIYETYFKTSGGKISEINSETLNILNNHGHKKIKESILSTYIEVDPQNGRDFFKTLQEKGELPPSFEPYLKLFK